MKTFPALIAGALIILATGCATRPPDGKPVGRVTAWMADPAFHETTSEELLNWVREDAPMHTVRTPRDRLPNGLAAGMTSFLVDWSASRPDDPDDGFYIVHNVNVAGNAVVGENVLGTVRIPTRAIQRVEYLLVRVALSGLAKNAGHGQLRFVFDPDNRPRILGKEAEKIHGDTYLDDLVVSWEAWRPTLEAWTAGKGLDPEAFTLTARMYAGPYRFANDSLRGSFWECFPLALPDVEHAEEYLLRTSLLLGDSLTRRVIGDMLDLNQLKSHDLPSGDVWTQDDIDRVHRALDWEEIPDKDAQAMLSEADMSYQTLLRSCVTLALAQVDLAAQWIHEDYNLGPRERVKVAPDKLPKWFDSMVSGDRSGVITGIPGALAWYSHNQTVQPGVSYKLLDRVGLLQRDEKGRPVHYMYRVGDITPYGKLTDNQMQ